mmetsp:Transcript_53368/g.153060  ORF Transcript_53368/g.153060 Transcript_53368/m.153060 type:complete len:420 (-) Transcript_53368:923-2182(-)
MERPRGREGLDGGLWQHLPGLHVPRHAPDGVLVPGEALQEVGRERLKVRLHPLGARDKPLLLVAEQIPQRAAEGVEQLSDLLHGHHGRLPVGAGRLDVTDDMHRGQARTFTRHAQSHRVVVYPLHPEALLLLASSPVCIEEERTQHRPRLGVPDAEGLHVLVPDLVADLGLNVDAEELVHQCEERLKHNWKLEEGPDVALAQTKPVLEQALTPERGIEVIDGGFLAGALPRECPQLLHLLARQRQALATQAAEEGVHLLLRGHFVDERHVREGRVLEDIRLLDPQLEELHQDLRVVARADAAQKGDALAVAVDVLAEGSVRRMFQHGLHHRVVEVHLPRTGLCGGPRVPRQPCRKSGILEHVLRDARELLPVLDQEGLRGEVVPDVRLPALGEVEDLSPGGHEGPPILLLVLLPNYSLV